MDVLYTDEGGMWFQSSGTWPDERAVEYGDGVRLVPLMANEVPFSYPPELVFLWDSDRGIAVATLLELAAVPVECVTHTSSRVALFGAGFEEGHCYKLATQGKEMAGGYPTVQELQQSGTLQAEADVSYVETGVGTYHCQAGSCGQPLDALPAEAVVGASTTVAGFLATGFAAAVFAGAYSRWTFHRLCAVSAGSMDLPQAVEANAVDATAKARPVEWFASRVMPHGTLNMGFVDTRDNLESHDCLFDLPVGAERLYMLNPQGVGPPLYACGRYGRAGFRSPGGLSGFYVYAVMPGALPGTSYHPFSFKGCASVRCGCPVCACGIQPVGCYRAALDSVPCDCGYVTWAEFVAMDVSHEKIGKLRVTRPALGHWHVGDSGGWPMADFVAAAYEARAAGSQVFTAHEFVIRFSDCLGAASAMAEAILTLAPGLKSVGAGKLDELGARHVGMTPSMLGAPEKRHVKVLETVGDTALSLVLSLKILDAGGTAQDYQELRSKISNNAYLRDKFVQTPLLASAFVGNASEMAPKTGGGAFEGVVAVIYLSGGIPAVEGFLGKIKFYGET